MSITARLQKVTQGLSPLQRISLVLQALRDGRDADPELARIDDPQQKRVFNRYIALLFCCNAILGPRIHALGILCQDLEGAAERVRLLEQAAGVLEEENDLKRPRHARDWRNVRGRMGVNEFLRSLAAELRDDLLDVLALRWQELLAVELVWDELGEEFGGEDPVSPELRAKAAAASALLQALVKQMGGLRRLVEPDEATVAEARTAVDEAYRQLEPLL
jgi:hypothetical protein